MQTYDPSLDPDRRCPVCSLRLSYVESPTPPGNKVGLSRWVMHHLHKFLDRIGAPYGRMRSGDFYFGFTQHELQVIADRLAGRLPLAACEVDDHPLPPCLSTCPEHSPAVTPTDVDYYSRVCAFLSASMPPPSPARASRR